MNPSLPCLHFYLHFFTFFFGVLVNPSPKQEAIQLDGEIFFSLLRRTCPMAYRHLKKFKIDPILYMTEWFMCIFSRTLPWACVLRVWDMFFCEGTTLVLTRKSVCGCRSNMDCYVIPVDLVLISFITKLKSQCLKVVKLIR